MNHILVLDCGTATVLSELRMTAIGNAVMTVLAFEAASAEIFQGDVLVAKLVRVGGSVSVTLTGGPGNGW